MLEAMLATCASTGLYFFTKGTGFSFASKSSIRQYTVIISASPARKHAHIPNTGKSVCIPVVRIRDTMEQNTATGMNLISSVVIFRNSSLHALKKSLIVFP